MYRKRAVEFEEVWTELDMEFGLVERMSNRRRCKRKVDSEEKQDDSDDGQCLSVVLPNEIGPIDYLQEKLVEMGGETG